MSDKFYWCQFRVAELRESDFDFDDLAESLDLNAPQGGLLRYQLNDFEIAIWFNDRDGEPPYLEIVTFWEHSHLASIPLAKMLDAEHLSDDQIEDAAEIVALEKLKEAIDGAIERRRTKLAGRQ